MLGHEKSSGEGDPLIVSLTMRIKLPQVYKSRRLPVEVYCRRGTVLDLYDRREFSSTKENRVLRSRIITIPRLEIYNFKNTEEFRTQI